jgi:hypothetical protein
VFLDNTFVIITLLSASYLFPVLHRHFGMDGATRPVASHASKSFVVSKHPQTEDGDGACVPLELGHRYSELIGSLLYIANTTRPDISYMVGVLSPYRNCPTTSHWQEALRVLRYLKGTRSHGIAIKTIVLGESDEPLVGFVDADGSGDLDDRKSTSGFVFQVYGGPVVWGSKKQGCVATSTVLAEFVATSAAVKEATWLRGLLSELDIHVWKVKPFCDSFGYISNLKNPINSQYTKRIANAFHHAREDVVRGNIDLEHVVSAENVAEIYPKALDVTTFLRHKKGFSVG